jgi:hypothetical protein
MQHIPKGFLLIVLSSLLLAQSTYPPPTNLVTIPTAGTLVRGSFSLDMRVQKDGGFSTGLKVGITDRFQFGMSFGASNLIGDDSLKWYPHPEVNIKYRLIDETKSMPGIAIGLNSQGYGAYNEILERYEVKAYGLYAAASKNWATPLGNMGIHVGVNQNFLEILDQDEDQSLFMGIDLEFNPELSLLVEYNAALNENDMKAEDIAINRGGYLNAAVRWTFVERLHIEMDFNNLLFNEDKVDYFNRELKIIYIEYF